MITLLINDTELAITKDSYKESLGSVEDTHTTEAGTTIREITRVGIYGLDISMTGTEEEKIFLDAAVQLDYLTVKVWDETAGGQAEHRMYIDPSSYSSSLIVEDAHHRYYDLSFKLEDLE